MPVALDDTPRAVGTIVQLKYYWLVHGQICQNVQTFRAGFGTPTLNQLIQDAYDCLVAQILPHITDEVRLTAVSAKILAPVAGDEIIYQAAQNDVGALGGHSLPTFNAARIQLRTGLAGKGYRGRMYLPGIPEAYQQNSRLDPAFVAFVVGFMVCMAGKFLSRAELGNRWDWGVYSRTLNKAARAGGPVFTAYNAYQVASDIGSITRRKIGRGI